MLPRLLARSWPELPLEVPSVPIKIESFFPPDRVLRSEKLHHPRGVAASDFRPLRNIPYAASRRSLGRISVPVWPNTLSGRLSIAALVSHYLTNKLIDRGPLLKRHLVKK